MRGETIIVVRRVQVGVDEGNNPVYETEQETVANVLVGSPNGENAADSNRPDGIQIDADLYFPRSYTGVPLRGQSVIVKGRKYRVVGDPFPVDGGMTPTDWNMTVPVTRSDG
ncbi:hypothetical protein JS533_005215 [Bifidobacterium amazonense]|uniref:Phage protein n=1 Tax=Bifidobacterium amazonense TaxID=2809027 RepID=A0ABS9VU98_9BIFI|nr:hypothetical protein [Bifidobacterium amazonense]MCH9275673.1 hypothetical protein [Bifidobacterium amazonense]